MGKLKRGWGQLIAFFAQNPIVTNYFNGRIVKSQSKVMCVPSMNCYSCPAAVGSCPIGSMQAVASGYKHNFSFYIFGIIALFALTVGRFWCGWVCPFGWFQELLYKIPFYKVKGKSKRWKKIDAALRYVKYIMLIVLVLLLPAFLTDNIGFGNPTFCKYVCPVGTLEGGIPLVLSNPGLRNVIGGLFWWKVFCLIVLVLLSLSIIRPFCRYICPLGAIYGLFNRFSFFRMDLDKNKCISCGKCEQICPMNVKVLKNINGAECIRCGKCKSACPTSAISVVTIFNTGGQQKFPANLKGTFFSKPEKE